MNGSSTKSLPAGRTPGAKRPDARLPAMLAAGCVLFAGHAGALELGELEVESFLGQPLRASIAYALGPHEQVAGYCIFVRGGGPAAGLPEVNAASVNVANGRIHLTSRGALREPMMNLRLSVDCAYTARIRRDYLLLLDPATNAGQQRPAADVAPATADAAPSPARRQAVAARTPRDASRPAAPLPSGSRYRVQPGDTLSDIAARIPDRSMTLWPTVDALYNANPQAFIAGDRNRLRAGAELVVPDFLSAAGVTADADAAASVREPSVSGTRQAAAAAAVDAPAPAEPRAAPAPAVPAPVDAAGPAAVVRDDAIKAETVAPQNSNAGPRAATQAAPVPVVGNRVGADNVAGGNSLAWLLWLAGSGVAIILGLLLFGRAVRARMGGTPAASQPRRRRTDRGEAAREDAVIDDLQDTMSRAEIFALDADLDDGSGFDSTPDLDVAQDFRFAASDGFDGDLDLSFDENSAREPETVATDMLPPPAFSDTVIVDHEQLPSRDDDDGAATGYDLSMVVDVTQQDFGSSDASTRDLHAVVVSSLDDDSEGSGSYTLNEEAGHRLIELDYEEELSATQALNRDIELAARELAERLDSDDDGSMTADDGDDEQAVTVQAVAADDDRADSGARDLQDAMELTAEMPAARAAVNDDLGSNERTAEMPADQNEVTVEMEARPARAKPRKSKAS